MLRRENIKRSSDLLGKSSAEFGNLANKSPMFENVRMAFMKHFENLPRTSEYGKTNANTKSCFDFSAWVEVAENAKQLLRGEMVASNMKS